MDTTHIPFVWSREHLLSILLSGKHQIVKDPRAVEAFKEIDRVDFIPDAVKPEAYMDKELDIGFGQRIDKPTTVAQQINLLAPKEKDKCLDIGVGSGYTTALLGYIVGKNGKIVGLDRVLYMIHQARENIKKYPELENVIEIAFKDAREGYADEAPYDCILVSVAFETVPQALLNQLAIGGRLLIPNHLHELRLITKIDDKQIKEEIYPGYVFDRVQEGVE